MYNSFTTNIPIEEIRNELLPFIPKIVTFINKYVKCDKKTNRTNINSKVS